MGFYNLICSPFLRGFTQPLTEIAEERANTLINQFLSKLQEEFPKGIESAQDPDMQIALFNAQKDYAKNGNNELASLLVDLLIQRTKMQDEELKKIVLNESLLVAPKITNKQLNVLSLRFLISMSRNHQINNVDKFNEYLKNYIHPFCNELAKELSDYQHIEYVGCGTVGVISNHIYDYMKGNYAGVLSTGFELEKMKDISLTPEQIQKIIIPCLRNKNKVQVSAINDEAIEQIGSELKLSDELISQLKAVQNNNLITADDFKKMLTDLHSDFEKLYRTWEQSGLGRLQLTTVGIALAHANIKKTINVDLDLGIWIK